MTNDNTDTMRKKGGISGLLGVWSKKKIHLIQAICENKGDLASANGSQAAPPLRPPGSPTPGESKPHETP